MKNHNQIRPCRASVTRPGFALVITLSLMILLTVVAVGLLTLSTISLRASSNAMASGTARSNARMAMLLAIGELQRQTGTDTRVTARADILDEENPPVLGVWNSWMGTNHETTGSFQGRPKSPGSNYRSVKESRFVGWLTSRGTGDPKTLPDTKAGDGKVALVGTGSLGSAAGNENLQIHLAPTMVATPGQEGGLAWWIGGDNQKARLPRPYEPEPAGSHARWAVHAKSHSVADPEPFRLESLLDDPAPADKAISLQ